MTINPSLFEAYLKCPTKCWLRSTGEPTAGNAYAEWVQTQNESYRPDAAKRLTVGVPADECPVAPAAEDLKAVKWRLAFDVIVRVESRRSRDNEAQTPKSEIQNLRLK